MSLPALSARPALKRALAAVVSSSHSSSARTRCQLGARAADPGAGALILCVSGGGGGGGPQVARRSSYNSSSRSAALWSRVAHACSRARPRFQLCPLHTHARPYTHTHHSMAGRACVLWAPSLAMVLNTLSIDPRRTWKGPWRWSCVLPGLPACPPACRGSVLMLLQLPGLPALRCCTATYRHSPCTSRKLLLDCCHAGGGEQGKVQ